MAEEVEPKSDRNGPSRCRMENHEKRYLIWKEGFDVNVAAAISNVNNGEQTQIAGSSNNVPDMPTLKNGTNTSPGIQRGSSAGTFTVFFEHKNAWTSFPSKPGTSRDGSQDNSVENGNTTPQSEQSDNADFLHEVTSPAFVKDEAPSGILEGMFFQLEVEFALLTHKLYHQGVGKDELERKLIELSDRILTNAIAEHGDQVTRSISDSYRVYAQVQYRKVESTNTLNKHIMDTVNEVLDTKFKSVEESFGYEWLAKSETEIKALAEADDPCGLTLMKSLGNKWLACYRRLKKDRFETVIKAIRELKTYEKQFSKHLDNDICSFDDPELISYRARALRSITPEHERVLTGILAQKFHQIIDIIYVAMKEKNTKATKGELEISQRALEYAKDKYEELIDPVIRKNGPQMEHEKIAGAIVASFLKVADFVYTNPWTSKRDELKSLMETEFNELSKRTDVFSKFVIAKYSKPMDKKVMSFQETMESRIRDASINEENKALLDEFQSAASTIVSNFDNGLVCSDDCKKVVVAEFRQRLLDVIEKVRVDLILPRSRRSASASVSAADTAQEIPQPASPIPGPSWRIDPVSSQAPISSNTDFDDVSFLDLEDIPTNPNSSGLGVGILFSPDGIYVSMHQSPYEEHYTTISPYLFLRQMDDVPVYAESGGHTSVNSNFYNIYQFLTDPKLNKTEETYSFPGKNVRLWAEEILALFFNKLKNQIQQLWERDISPYSFAIALPTFVSSGCKRRLKTALSLAGLHEPVFVQTTTAIGVSYLKSTSIVLNHYAIAIYIQDTVMDLSLFKASQPNLTVQAIHGSTTFPGIREELTGMIFMNIESAIQSIVQAAGIDQKAVRSCTCVVDCTAFSESPESESSLLLLSWLSEVFRSIFSRETEITVSPVRSGLLKGLTAISSDQNTGATRRKVFKEVFPFSLELKNVPSLGDDNICFVSKDDEATEKKITVQACMLGSKSKASRIIRRFDGQQLVELQLSIEESFKKIAPDSAIDIIIDDQGLISTHSTFINKSGSPMPGKEVKMVTESHYIPPQCVEQAQLRVRDIIDASEGRGQGNPDVVTVQSATLSSDDSSPPESPSPPRKKSKRGRPSKNRYMR